jgi:ATP-dependent DNA ligase
MSSIPSFPTLYGKASTGKIKMWSIKVEDQKDASHPKGGVGAITTTHGYVDGKLQINTRLVTVGKNLGKKNETTPVQQAVNEAQSDWKKKTEAGGMTEKKPEAEKAGDSDKESVKSAKPSAEKNAKAAEDAGVIPHPMLAHDYNKRGKDIKFPCYAQKKLDGVRCLAISGKGLYSRTGKAFPHMDHIRAEINSLPKGTILDGELYSDTLTFQEIVGLVKKETLKDADNPKMTKIYLCVYDTVMDGTNTERNAYLTDLFKKNKFTALRLLPTDVANNLEDVKKLHADYVAAGYEGLILRNKAGLYKVGHRSADLQKYKEFMDDEYKIVGFKEGDGIEKGCVIWICETKTHKQFSVRPRGTHEERATAFKTASKQVGKKLTVRFQELTDDGIPRFPVGLAIRDYE